MIIVTIIGGVLGFFYFKSHYQSIQSVASTCGYSAGISSHVYNPDRLEMVKACMTVSGTVDALRGEKDGDYHVILRLDPAYDNLTNSANDQYQNGGLVVEIICVLTVTQPDAASACQNYTNHVLIPIVGQHIIVSGPYVLDSEHYDWAEIHPVYSLNIS